MDDWSFIGGIVPCFRGRPARSAETRIALTMAAWDEFRRQLGLLGRIALDTVLLATTPVASQGSSVCIVRVDGIGDFVLWIDACRQLSARYRGGGSRVVLVANASWAQWARELELADEVWEFDRARVAREIRYRAHWIRQMRAAGIRGAGHEMRAWPISSFAETGRRLAARGLGLVVVGGAGDRPAAQALLRELPGNVEDFTGRTTLGELAAILAGARLVVSNESGAAHMAAAAGTAVVCVMGGGR